MVATPIRISEDVGKPVPSGSGFGNPLLDMSVFDFFLWIIIVILLFLLGHWFLKWWFARRDQPEDIDFYMENYEGVMALCKKHADKRYYSYKRWDILKRFPKGIPIDLKDPRTAKTTWIGNYVGSCYSHHDGCLNLLYASSNEFHLGRWFPYLGIIKIRERGKQLVVVSDKKEDKATGKMKKGRKTVDVEFPTTPFYWGNYSIDIFCGGLDELAGFEYPIVRDKDGNLIEQTMFVTIDWTKLAEIFQNRDFLSGSVRSMYQAVRMNPEGQLKKRYGAKGMSMESGEIPSA